MKTQAIKYLNSLITDETKKSEIDLIEFCEKCVYDNDDVINYAKESLKTFIDEETKFIADIHTDMFIDRLVKFIKNL